MCIYIYVFFLFPLLYYNYSFIYLYKGYANYIHISRGYVKHKRLRTTDLECKGRKRPKKKLIASLGGRTDKTLRLKAGSQGD
jgi:hypothetical protein